MPAPSESASAESEAPSVATISTERRSIRPESQPKGICSAAENADAHEDGDAGEVEADLAGIERADGAEGAVGETDRQAGCEGERRDPPGVPQMHADGVVMGGAGAVGESAIGTRARASSMDMTEKGTEGLGAE
ncbi:MAG: hypothetical protein R3D33_17690 [Hyphomicrobiaceae bacterium]